jgi:hypothetical protein
LDATIKEAYMGRELYGEFENVGFKSGKGIKDATEVRMGQSSGMVTTKFKYEQGPRFTVGSDELYRVGHNIEAVYFDMGTKNGGVGETETMGTQNILDANNTHTFYFFGGEIDTQTGQYMPMGTGGITGKFVKAQTVFNTEPDDPTTNEDPAYGEFDSFTITLNVNGVDTEYKNVKRWDVQVSPAYWKQIIIQDITKNPVNGTEYKFYIDFVPQTFEIKYADHKWLSATENAAQNSLDPEYIEGSTYTKTGTPWTEDYTGDEIGFLDASDKYQLPYPGNVLNPENYTKPRPTQWTFTRNAEQFPQIGVPVVKAEYAPFFFKTVPGQDDPVAEKNPDGKIFGGWYSAYDPKDTSGMKYTILNPAIDTSGERWGQMPGGGYGWIWDEHKSSGFEYVVIAANMVLTPQTMWANWRDTDGSQIVFDTNLPSGTLNGGGYGGQTPWQIDNVNGGKTFNEDNFRLSDIEDHGGSLSISWVQNLELDGNPSEVEYTFLGWTEYTKEGYAYYYANAEYRARLNAEYLAQGKTQQEINEMLAGSPLVKGAAHIKEDDPQEVKYPATADTPAITGYKDRYYIANWSVRKVTVTQYDKIGNFGIVATQYDWGTNLNLTNPPRLQVVSKDFNYDSLFSAYGGAIGGARFGTRPMVYEFRGWAESGTVKLSDTRPKNTKTITYNAMWTLKPDVMEIVLNNLKRIDRSKLSGEANYNLFTQIQNGDELLGKIKVLSNQETLSFNTVVFNDYIQMGFDNTKITQMQMWLVNVANILNQFGITDLGTTQSTEAYNVERLKELRTDVSDYLESLLAGGISLVDSHSPTDPDAHQNLLQSITEEFDDVLRSNNWDKIANLEIKIYNLFIAMRTDNGTTQGASCVDEVKNIIPVDAYGKLKAAYRRFDAIIREYETDTTIPVNVRAELKRMLDSHNVNTPGLKAKTLRGWVTEISRYAVQNGVPFEGGITTLAGYVNGYARIGEPWIWPVSHLVNQSVVDEYIEMAYRVYEYASAGNYFGINGLRGTPSESIPMTLESAIKIQEVANLRRADLYDFKLKLDTLVDSMMLLTENNPQSTKIKIAGDGLPESLPSYPNDAFKTRLENIVAVFKDYALDPTLYNNYPNEPGEWIMPFLEFIQVAEEALHRIPPVWNNSFYVTPIWDNKEIPTMAEIRGLVRLAIKITADANTPPSVIAARGYAYTFGPYGATSPEAIGSFGNKNNDPTGVKLTAETRARLLARIAEILDLEFAGFISRDNAERTNQDGSPNENFEEYLEQLFATLTAAQVMLYSEQAGREYEWLLRQLAAQIPGAPTGNASAVSLARLWELIYFTEEVLPYVSGTQLFVYGTDLVNDARMVASATNPPSTEAMVQKEIVKLEDFLLAIMDLLPEGAVVLGPDGKPILTPKDATEERERLGITIEILREYADARQSLHGLNSTTLIQLSNELELAVAVYENSSATAGYINDTVAKLIAIVGINNQEKIDAETGLLSQTGRAEALAIGGRPNQLTALEQLIYNAREYINKNYSGAQKTELLAGVEAAADKYEAAKNDANIPAQEIWKARKSLEKFLADHNIVISPIIPLGDKETGGLPVGLIIFFVILLLLLIAAALAARPTYKYIHNHPEKIQGVKNAFGNVKTKITGAFHRGPRTPKAPKEPKAPKAPKEPKVTNTAKEIDPFDMGAPSAAAAPEPKIEAPAPTVVEPKKETPPDDFEKF